MSQIPYDSANGENIFDGTSDLKTPDDAYDATPDSEYLMQASDFADLRDVITYMSGSAVIGNAKKIQGVDVDATTAATPSDNEVLQYDSGDGEWKAQPLELAAIDYIDLTPQGTAPSEIEGRIYFDDVKQNMVVFNDATGTAQDVGRELRLSRAYNNTGSAITNGQIVYISGASGSYPEVSLAIANTFDTSRVIAMCTEASVANGALGEFTTFGCVGGVDTSAYTAGDKIYLSTATAGAFSGTMPTGEYFACSIGTVVTSDASDGKILFITNTPDTAAEVTRNKGFPADALTEATLSFVDGTRTFTITPAVDEFHFYQEGIQYRIEAADSIVISDTDGSHFIYYDDGVLSEMVNPSDSQVFDLILNKPLVAYVYWNTAEATATIVAEERHKAQTMDGFTPRNHAYTHIHDGAKYTSGFTPDTVGTGGTGASNADAQFGIGSGAFDDEDIINSADAILSTTGCRYLYRSGASGYWTYGTNSGYSFPVGATPLPQYNENTGSTWQLTEVTSGNFMLLHVFGVNSIDSAENTVCILGQEQYATIAAVQTAAEDDILNFSRGIDFPFQEFTPVATFILECKTSFTNTPNARLVVNGDGDQYTDFRGYTSGAVSGGGGGGTTPPGGSDGQIQYNNGGAFGGSSALTFDDLTNTVNVTNLTAASGTQTLSNASITGGTIDGPTIGSTTEATIDHDALANYVANDHVDHSTVDITGGVGLTGGGAITTSRAIDLDVNGLTAESTVDGASDYIAMYDTSAGTHRKVLPDNLGYASLDGAMFTGAVAIPSGTINNTVIGGTTPAASTFTSVTLGGQPVSDILTSSDSSSTSNSALVTAGYVDAHGGGGGDVTGPASSTDNAIVTFDGTGGDTVQDSGLIISTSSNTSAIQQESTTDFNLQLRGGTTNSTGSFLSLYGNGYTGNEGNALLTTGTQAGSFVRVKLSSGTSYFEVDKNGGGQVAKIDNFGNATFSGAVSSANLSNPNILINSNGADPIDQRGVVDGVALSTGDFVVDRQKAVHDVTGVEADIQSDGCGILLNDITAGTGAEIIEVVEKYDQYQGKTITAKIWVVANCAAQVFIDDGVSTSTGTSHTGGASEEPLTVTATLSGSASKLEIGITVPVALNNYARITKRKAEESAVATTYTIPDQQQELARCHRFSIEKATSNYASVGYGWATSATNVSVQVSIPPEMRDKPTLAHSGNFRVTDGVSSIAVTALSVHPLFESPTDIIVSATVASGLTQYRIYSLEVNNDSTASFFLGAEL